MQSIAENVVSSATSSGRLLRHPQPVRYWSPATFSRLASKRWRRPAPAPLGDGAGRRYGRQGCDAHPYPGGDRSDRPADECRFRQWLRGRPRGCRRKRPALCRDGRCGTVDRGHAQRGRHIALRHRPRGRARRGGALGDRRGRRRRHPCREVGGLSRRPSRIVGRGDQAAGAFRRRWGRLPLRAGIHTREAIAALVKAVAPKPVNVLIGGPVGLSVGRSRGPRRPPRQRRRGAGASGLGRLHAGGPRDRRDRHLRSARPGGSFAELDGFFIGDAAGGDERDAETPRRSGRRRRDADGRAAARPRRPLCRSRSPTRPPHATPCRMRSRATTGSGPIWPSVRLPTGRPSVAFSEADGTERSATFYRRCRPADRQGRRGRPLHADRAGAPGYRGGRDPFRRPCNGRRLPPRPCT